MNYKNMCSALIDDWSNCVAIRTSNNGELKVCYNPLTEQFFIKTSFGWELYIPSDMDCHAVDWIVVKNI